ncbi:MAG: IPT/TIG domain-containing protein, partial [Bacillota bacterium]
GPKDVTVVNPDTARCTVYDGFDHKYPESEPRIYDITGDGEAIDPNYGTVQGGTVVTVEGEDFREGVRVFFGGSEASDVWVNGTRTVIKATTSAYTINDPEKDQETVDVTVVNYDGGSATEENGFTYMVPYSSPVITSLTPDFGSSAGGDMVTIRGRDFREKDSEGNYRAPKIYFGGIEAQSVSRANDNMIYAETPSYPEEGRVDVTIVNADAGTYVLKNGFEYRRSRPGIDSIIPGKGSRNGNQEIVIHGSDFVESDLSSYYEGETVYKHVYSRNPTIDLLVVLGDEKEEEHILGGRAEIALGNIRTVYEYVYGEDSTRLYYTSPEGVERLVSTYDIEPGEQHLFIVNGPEDLGDGNIMDEGVLVDVSDNVLKVTRRVAPHADIVNADPKSKVGTIVVVKTPPVPYTGERELSVTNKDGGTAAATFEYTNPDSNPLIFDIRPRREMYDSEGNLSGYQTIGSVDADTYITIDGADFRTGVRVFVEDIEAEVISRSNSDDQLVVRVPPGRDNYIGRLLRIVVVNRDGGTADSSLLSIKRWFRYERPGSGPVINYVKPDRTSAAGGNQLEIDGDDLRLDATVVIGGVPAINVRTDEWRYSRIYVETQEGMLPGVYDLQVINSDYGTATLKNGITIISWPRINYITDQNGGTIGSISFLGGDTIYLKGSGFMPGARVVFGGEIVPLDQAQGGGGIRGFNSEDQNVAVVGGKEALSVEVVDGDTIMLTTPDGVEGESTIVVINSDEGISDQFDIDYQPPIPDSPDDLDVSLVYDRYVRLEWPAVEDALYYEIYAREGTRGEFRFIASTTRTVYYIIDLDSDTRYYFMVKAINKFGSSEFTSRRSIRTDDTREKDTDGAINEEEKILVDGNAVTVNIPDDALKREYYYSIDLSGPDYSGAVQRTVNVPLEVIRDTHGTFTLNTGDVMLQFSPSALNAAPLWSVSRTDRDISYGRLTVGSAGSDGERAKKYLPAKQRVVSGLHYIGLSAVKGKTEEHCNTFNGSLNMRVKYNGALPQGMGTALLMLHRFDQESLKWEPIDAAATDVVSGFAYGYITRPGIYAVLGTTH